MTKEVFLERLREIHQSFGELIDIFYVTGEEKMLELKLISAEKRVIALEKFAEEIKTAATETEFIEQTAAQVRIYAETLCQGQPFQAEYVRTICKLIEMSAMRKDGGGL